MNWIECKVDDDIKRVLMVKDPIGIGRSATCEFSFPGDKEVSRLHAIIELRGQHWYLVDQKSTNGSFVNSQRVTVPFPLKEGDLIEIGSQRLHVKSGLYLRNQESSGVKYLGYPHHYVVLKAELDATAEALESNYHALRKIYDPELHPDEPLLELLNKELEEAYEVLHEPERRAAYDATLKAQKI